MSGREKTDVQSEVYTYRESLGGKGERGERKWEGCMQQKMGYKKSRD